MAVLENLKPERVFYYFEEICNIPHGSGNTKQISDYLVEFAKKKELRFIQDEMGNGRNNGGRETLELQRINDGYG